MLFQNTLALFSIPCKNTLRLFLEVSHIRANVINLLLSCILWKNYLVSKIFSGSLIFESELLSHTNGAPKAGYSYDPKIPCYAKNVFRRHTLYLILSSSLMLCKNKLA